MTSMHKSPTVLFLATITWMYSSPGERHMELFEIKVRLLANENKEEIREI